MRRILGLIAALSLLQIAAPALAQNNVSAKVVSACGTPGQTPVVGNSYTITQDTTLTLCTSGSGGGGGGGAITAASGSYASGALSAGSVVDIGTGASPAANTVNARLVTLNTTLGSPFQVGGSIGNASFGISGTLPAYAATPTFNLGTLNGAATAAKQPALGTAGASSADVISVQGIAGGTALPVSGTVTANAGTNLNTSALATSANLTAGTAKTQIVDGSGNVIASTSNNLNVQCANCSGSGVSTADEASMTFGTSLFAGSGGVYQTTATNNALTTGQQGMFQVTANRALFSNLRNAAGTEVGTSTTPLQVSLANTAANGTAVKVDGSAVTQPVSGTVSITANSAVNIAQMNGVATTMGNGVSGTGVQRVTIASDSTGQVTLASGASVGVSNLPTTVDTNTGAPGASTLRTVSAAPTTIYSTQKTVSTSASAMTAQALANGLVLTALPTNSAAIYVGPTGVTTSTGYALQPGASISYGVTNASAIFIISAASTTDGITATGN